MTTHRFARAAALWAAACSTALDSGTSGSAYAQQRPSPPNIVFVLVDDLGWSDVGCYGNRLIDTPNIDRLAARGMRFTDAYAACPVCSPTRASLMTGRYPATLGLTDFIPGHWRPHEKLIVPKIRGALPLSEVTLAEAIAPAGYRCGYFGKWHLGPRTHYPDRQGFDVSHVTSGSHTKWRAQPPFEGKDPSGEYLADRLTDEAEHFLEANRKRPFFLYLAHYAVHIPLQADAARVAKYREKTAGGTSAIHPTYAAMVEHVDASVGRLAAKLDTLKLTDRTLFIFFSDNGGLVRRYDDAGPIVTTNAPLRREKGTLYEGGIRVPLIVRGPGIAAGSTCRVPVCSVDFWPTLLELSGAKPPAGHRPDGVSLVGLLHQKGTLRRDALYWHYPHYHHMAPAGAVRRGNWKLIEQYQDGSLELYDLKEDISEKHNVAAKHPLTTRKLHWMLVDWRKSTGASMPTPNPAFDPKKAQQWKPRPRE